jgi:alpha-amylase
LAAQANAFANAGFTAIWLPPPLKGASGSFSSGYDLFDEYDLGAKNQKGTIPTRYGTREKLQRCAAVMRANGIDVYVDLVENQRDGDDGHFNFKYLDAFGRDGGGRFAKGPGDFHHHVSEDPGVFSDQFQFGRDLAPINGTPKDHCSNGLIAAAEWLTRALDLQGYRLDNAKGVSTVFMQRLLSTGAIANKFAVAEFADGNTQLIESWRNAVQHRSAAFDFPLHFAWKDMCNNPDSFNMASLDHAGLVGIDPQGAVTFVENHDTDRGGVGGPIVRNKMLAYAYIQTSEGYPCVFYRDYSTDKNCFGLRNQIDRLIQIHEQLAEGPTQQRWKDGGVFIFERMGGGHLLSGLNKDANASRRVTVQTGFPPNTRLQEFTGHGSGVSTKSDSQVDITIPRNENGNGYVCYAMPRELRIPARAVHATTQVYEGAQDLDIKPALENEKVQVCCIFAEAQTQLQVQFSFDASGWTAATVIQFEIDATQGGKMLSHKFGSADSKGSTMTAKTSGKGFCEIFVQVMNPPTGNKTPRYKLAMTYTAP